MGKVCSVVGCPLIAGRDGRCPQHKRVAWEGSRPSHGCDSGWEWGRLRAKVLKERPLCWCGAEAAEVHHRIRGSKNPDDLETLCKHHHKEITQKQAARARANNVKDL